MLHLCLLALALPLAESWRPVYIGHRNAVVEAAQGETTPSPLAKAVESMRPESGQPPIGPHPSRFFSQSSARTRKPSFPRVVLVQVSGAGRDAENRLSAADRLNRLRPWLRPATRMMG